MNQTTFNYVLPSGREPVEDWLSSLKDVRARAKIRARINQIRSGNPGNFRSVGNGVTEMKIDFGPGYRIYYAVVGVRVVLLLCGGDKNTQQNDIEKAIEFLSDYKRRTKEKRENE